jgi:hypothetical protein
MTGQLCNSRANVQQLYEDDLLSKYGSHIAHDTPIADFIEEIVDGDYLQKTLASGVRADSCADIPVYWNFLVPHADGISELAPVWFGLGPRQLQNLGIPDLGRTPRRSAADDIRDRIDPLVSNHDTHAFSTLGVLESLAKRVYFTGDRVFAGVEYRYQQPTEDTRARGYTQLIYSKQLLKAPRVIEQEVARHMSNDFPQWMYETHNYSIPQIHAVAQKVALQALKGSMA